MVTHLDPADCTPTDRYWNHVELKLYELLRAIDLLRTHDPHRSGCIIDTEEMVRGSVWKLRRFRGVL